MVGGPRTAMKSGPCLPQLEKALAQKRRPNTAKKKKKKKPPSNHGHTDGCQWSAELTAVSLIIELNCLAARKAVGFHVPPFLKIKICHHLVTREPCSGGLFRSRRPVFSLHPLRQHPGGVGLADSPPELLLPHLSFLMGPQAPQAWSAPAQWPLNTVPGFPGYLSFF